MIRSIFFVLLLAMQAAVASAQRYVFYLHGKIVEDQGPNASNQAYGAYEYENILTALRKEKFTVISECRKPNTDVKDYARKVVTQIDSLLRTGAKPGDISVIGASKGAMIAMYVSSFLKDPKVNFIFMSSCNDYVLNSSPDINFCGNILSIYEKSDESCQSCEKFKQRSTLKIPHYKEIMLNTGLHHGYLYKPLPEWVKPAAKWARGAYD